MKRYLAFLLMFTTALVLLLLTPIPRAGSASSATLTVNSTADPGVVGDGALTLREAMQLVVGDLALSSLSPAEVAQVSGSPGIASADIVRFDLDVFPPESPATIVISGTVGALPPLSTNDDALDASDAGVIVDGSDLSGVVDGFTVASQRNTIRGFQIINFPGSGIALINHTKFTIIGGDRTHGSGPSGEGNVVFGNGASAIRITGSDTLSNTVSGNLIGTDVTGTTAAPVGNRHGIQIEGRARANIIGGTTPGERNVISGNEGDGVRIVDAHDNRVIGNHIGTNITGTISIADTWGGVNILQGATHNVIGGSTAGEANVISGNALYGLAITGAGTELNRVLGNLIGTDISGLIPLPNGSDGIRIHAGAHGNIIGGLEEGEGNVISGNQADGVQIRFTGTTGNWVLGNLIGTAAGSLSAMPNGAWGVSISDGAQVNAVGGTEVGAGNVIAGNGLGGVSIVGPGTISNVVQGNLIGTDLSGVATLGNGSHGVWISSGAQNNVIGGTVPGAGNVIAGNRLSGVSIMGTGTISNVVQGNYIGTDLSGVVMLGNGSHGVSISSGAQNNVIGGDISRAGNVIVNNSGDGVHVTNPSSTGDAVLGNSITNNAGLGIENADGGNGELPPPILVEATFVRIRGTVVISTSLRGATSSATVEIFSDDADEGRVFEGRTTVDEKGAFIFEPLVPLVGPNITATVTDAEGNTSEFSAPALLTPPPRYFLWVPFLINNESTSERVDQLISQ